MIQGVKHITRNNIPGDIVECGVWRGGSMMAVAHTLLRLKQKEKPLFLFDTFAGMSEPTEFDVNVHGLKATDKFIKKRAYRKSDWAFASLDER